MPSAALAAALAFASAGPAAAEQPALVPCLAVAADSTAVFPTETFPNPTTEVSACFRLGPNESAQRLTAVFIAEDVGAAAPPNYAIVEANLDLEGQKQGRFRFENPRPMPIGAYRVEVSTDSGQWHSARFAVVETDAVDIPADLMPVQTGRRWTYRFEQRAGEGATIDLPGAQPGTRVHGATATIEVVGEEELGFHLVTSRNGKPVFEEWWQRGEDGVLVTRRKQGEDVTELDPPQRLVGAVTGERAWTYPPFGQSFRMWGPFSMQGGWGEGYGYVVLASQPAGPFTVTAERHFVPGIGMVREVIIQALAGRMLSRQEMELVSASD